MNNIPWWLVEIIETVLELLVFMIPVIIYLIISLVKSHKAKIEARKCSYNKWELAESIMKMSVKEALPILDDAMSNGFEFRITNDSLYFREVTPEEKIFSKIFK